jgi:hypothetical protein
LTSTVAIELLAVPQVPPATASVNEMLNPEHTVVGPVIDVGLPITVTVAVAAVPQPVEYVIVALPALPPVTVPVVFTLATVLLLLFHVPPATASVNAMVKPEHTVEGPAIETGVPVTVIVVVLAVPQPVE